MLLSLLVATALAVTPDAPNTVLNREGATLRARFSAELGALVPLVHTIQFDKDGTVFDYVEEGGQSNLFPFTRFQADLDIGDRHTVVLLYQPLDLASTSVIKRDVSVADVTFPEGTPMAYRYGFSFVRGSWMYDLAEGPRKEAALGVSLQVRNATIDFRSLDGELYTSQRDIGLVGGPLQMHTSASFPASSEPVRPSIRSCFAGLSVTNLYASGGGMSFPPNRPEYLFALPASTFSRRAISSLSLL